MGKKTRKKIKYNGEIGDLYKIAYGGPIKILSLPVDDGGCGYYRVRQPFDLIRELTEHDTYVVDAHKDNMLEVTNAFFATDILLVRPGSEAGLDKIKQIPDLKNIKAKTVMDIDDNVEVISPYSLHYKEYGTKEHFDKNVGKWLWKDGEEDWSIISNTQRVSNYIRGLESADMVTVTTPKLAEYASQYNKNVVVLPNCLDLTRWWPLPFRPNEQLRVGWTGGISHYEDLFSIKEPLNKLMREFKFKFVFIGNSFEGIIDKDNKNLIEHYPWVPFKAHSYRLMCMNLDIGIIPLADLPFNYYKSAVKWYEMSAIGVPSVVADITPYKEEIEDNKTAMAYKTPEQFYDAMKLLLTFPDKRKEIGNNANEWVKKNRDARKNINLWVEAYQSIIDKT